MKTPLAAAAAIAVAAPLIGCSSYSLTELKAPPAHAFGPEVRTDVAVVCVVRPSHFAVAVTFVLHDNGQLVGATRAESYFCYEAEPGEHAIVSSTGDSIDRDGTAHLSAVAGHRYWLHQDFDNFFGVVANRLQWVSEPRWRDLVEGNACEYKVLSGVPGNESLPDQLPLAHALAPATPSAAAATQATPATTTQ
jgi:hypothetical protein